MSSLRLSREGSQDGPGRAAGLREGEVAGTFRSILVKRRSNPNHEAQDHWDAAMFSRFRFATQTRGNGRLPPCSKVAVCRTRDERTNATASTVSEATSSSRLSCIERDPLRLPARSGAAEDMATLPGLSTETLCPLEFDPRSPKSLASHDSSQQHQHGELRDEPTACSWFDPDALALLSSRIPRTLELWRLRLRFGLPSRVAPGERFRVAIDLVDETGQPPPPRELGRLARSLRPPLIRLLQDDDGDSAERLALRMIQVPSKTPTKWIFDVSVECDEAAATTATALFCSLLIALNPSSDVADAKSAFHQDFQGFCTNSAWLADHVLVLPLQSDRIKVVLSPERLSCQPPATTTCRRLFSVSSPPGADASERSRQVIAITENYGDAMGAHIWDASILLSFALVDAAPPLSSLKEPVAMAELGAGCGLFACVFRALYAAAASAIVLTERAESARLLQSNMEQNEGIYARGGPPVQVVPLVWGHLPLPPALASSGTQGSSAVFAADVLYFWDGHAALLSTLAELSTRDVGLQVVIAHKHRGAATTRALEDVLARCSRHEGGDGDTKDHDDCEADAWSYWHVERLARLGKVDLLRLSRRR